MQGFNQGLSASNFLTAQRNANPALRRCSHDLFHSQKEPACHGCDPTPTLATCELALAN